VVSDLRGFALVTMAWQIGKWVLLALAVAVLGALVFMAFVRRDHKVELIVTYPESPPSAVWRLLTDHAAEPTWLPSFGTVERQADIAGHEVWTHTSPDRSFSATVMTVSAIPELRYERLLLRDKPAAGPIVGRSLGIRARAHRKRHAPQDHGVRLDRRSCLLRRAACPGRSRCLSEVLRADDRKQVERPSRDSSSQIALSQLVRVSGRSRHCREAVWTATAMCTRWTMTRRTVNAAPAGQPGARAPT
jgi:hypothetical protein